MGPYTKHYQQGYDASLDPHLTLLATVESCTSLAVRISALDINGPQLPVSRVGCTVPLHGLSLALSSFTSRDGSQGAMLATAGTCSGGSLWLESDTKHTRQAKLLEGSALCIYNLTRPSMDVLAGAHEPAATNLTWSPDGVKLAWEAEGSTLYIWDGGDGTIRHIELAQPIKQIRWSPNSKQLAVTHPRREGTPGFTLLEHAGDGIQLRPQTFVRAENCRFLQVGWVGNDHLACVQDSSLTVLRPDTNHPGIIAAWNSPQSLTHLLSTEHKIVTRNAAGAWDCWDSGRDKPQNIYTPSSEPQASADVLPQEPGNKLVTAGLTNDRLVIVEGATSGLTWRQLDINPRVKPVADQGFSLSL